MIVGVDPGPFETAWAAYKPSGLHGRPQYLFGAKSPNADIVKEIVGRVDRDATISIECIDSLGMAMGADHIETVYWTGRFVEALRREFKTVGRVRRRDVKACLCGTAASNDANVRMALMDRFGGKIRALGKKKEPGPLYGVKGDVWAALAVAVATADGIQVNYV